jgi:hypothetical protein
MLSDSFAEVVCLPSNLRRWPLQAKMRVFPDNGSICEVIIADRVYLMERRHAELYEKRQVIKIVEPTDNSRV